MLQNFLDMYLPHEPTKLSPRGPMQQTYFQAFDKDDSPAASTTDFHSMLGMVQQMMDIRQDVCFAVVKLAQRPAAPREKDIEALFYLLHYLYATLSSGLVLHRGHRGMANML